VPSFAVLTPSRGLVHSRTVEAVMANIDEATAARHKFRGWRLSHDLPIPDCHNAVAAAAMKTDADALWFVEEDVIPPPGALLGLFALLKDYTIAALDYPVWTEGGERWSCVCRDQDGGPIDRPSTNGIRYCGLGCTLVRRELFDRLPYPWFRSDMQFQIVRIGDSTRLVEVPVSYEYGGQDIYFAHRALESGFTIGELTGMTAGHARVVALGPLRVNHGAHTIETIDAIQRWQQI